MSNKPFPPHTHLHQHPDCGTNSTARTEWLVSRFGECAGIVLDSHGVIVAANEGAAVLLGRPPAELESRSFGVLTPVSRRVELDIVTLKGRKRGRISACILPHEPNDEFTYVRLERVEPAYRNLPELVMEAVADANQVRPCPPIHGLERVAEAFVRAESRQILADWLVFLIDLAGSPAAGITLRCQPHGRTVELQFNLRQSAIMAAGEPSLPFPERSAGLLEEIGGEFRVIAEYPETSVQLTLPVSKDGRVRPTSGAAAHEIRHS